MKKIIVLLFLNIYIYSQSLDLNYINGLNFYEDGKYQKAISEFDKAIKEFPNCEFFYIKRGDSKRKLNNFKGALNDYNKALDLNPSDDNYIILGITYVYLNDIEKALDALNKALDLNPNNSRAYNNRANLKYYYLQDKEGALNDYIKTYELNNCRCKDIKNIIDKIQEDLGI